MWRNALRLVAPLAGAWIETQESLLLNLLKMVAPLAGAWIETAHLQAAYVDFVGRSPCGSVD